MFICNYLFYVWGDCMIPKFKIGDKVKTKEGSVFNIYAIFITADCVEYSGKTSPCYYLECSLETFVEPKPKVKKYLYAYRVGNKPEAVSGYFHENDSDFKNDPHGQITWSKRLDWSMIEVEE